ncbi:hypothetical protein LAZ67_2003269 [Cordylochernes scorpioides]|uniref:Mos1 transposase HTH domain-containing protein n=1 Tax=Cordylochernes scorpioides TaxID=51811 RepID=A0ABY6K633_9ARAC|nr:hypothetical protein LAZ67_2003269 [Cordylochernes scorpioides]
MRGGGDVDVKQTVQLLSCFVKENVNVNLFGGSKWFNKLCPRSFIASMASMSLAMQATVGQASCRKMKKAHRQQFHQPCDSRSVIRFLAAKKNSAKDIHTELCQVYGEGCMSSGMVRRWVREFKNSRTDVHDEPRAGRPSDSYEIIAKVEAAMLEDRRVTVRKLCDLVPDISKTTIDKILREHLGYSKVCAILVPKMLTEDHKRQRVEAAQKFLDCHETDGEELLDSIVTGDETWVHYTTPETKEQSKQWKHTSSPKPLKFKQTLSAGKLMAPSFGTERAYCCATLCVGVQQ